MTTCAATDDGYADLCAHDSFVNGVPHNTFTRMREEEPVAWCDGGGHQGFWSLTRYHDIMEYNRNFKLLSSARGIRMEDQTHEEYLARRTFQETDPPEHTYMRVLVAKAFSKPVIAEYESIIRGLCDNILDKALARGEFDAVAEVARQLPMRMLGRILGVPDEDLDWLVGKGDELIANTDPEYARYLLDKDDTEAFRLMPFRSPAGAELWEYANNLVARRKGESGGGVLDLILQPNARGNVISPVEFRNFFCLLVAAGNDTTRYSIAASIHAIANQPGLLRQLQDGDAQLWETAPDEFIRWASPTLYFRRTATCDFELHGKHIREGDKVLFWFVSANRDDRNFDRPFEINVTRHPNRHMAFGQGGPHACLGMWLARLEVRVLLQELVKRVRSIRQNGEHQYLRSNFVTGIKRLPVAVEPV